MKSSSTSVQNYLCITLILILLIGVFVSCATQDVQEGQNAASYDTIIEYQEEILQVGTGLYTVKIADTPEKHYVGLSSVSELGAFEGMLFVYPESRQLTFWMKETNLMLSIAYIREDGVIVFIDDLFANSLKPVSVDEPVKYALELLMGAFRKSGVSVGDVLQLPDLEIP